jgi:hypothetical protein
VQRPSKRRQRTLLLRCLASCMVVLCSRTAATASYAAMPAGGVQGRGGDEGNPTHASWDSGDNLCNAVHFHILVWISHDPTDDIWMCCRNSYYFGRHCMRGPSSGKFAPKNGV